MRARQRKPRLNPDSFRGGRQKIPTANVNYIVDIGGGMAYTGDMIVGFRHKGLEELYLTGKTRRIGANDIRKCYRILKMLDDATKPEEMNISGFRFHGLHGTPQRWSVRVSGNDRITFGWSGEIARDVDFEDYH